MGHPTLSHRATPQGPHRNNSPQYSGVTAAVIRGKCPPKGCDHTRRGNNSAAAAYRRSQKSTCQATWLTAGVRGGPSTDVIPPDAGVATRGAAKEAKNEDVEGRFVVRASGWATDSGGGVVASVEVSWDGGVRYHPASIDVLRAETTWSFVWGDDPWQLLHGDLPKKSVLEGTEKLVLTLRVSDDSGNLAVVRA